MRIGVIGYGYWGPNMVRNLMAHPNVLVSVVADPRVERLAFLKKVYPAVKTTTNADEVIGAKDIDAVVVATPPATHYSLASAALLKGKHVLVEKPLATTLKEAQELVEIARKKKLVLMVDHTYLYNGAVRKIKDLIASGDIGVVQSFTSMRFNLGLFQSDVNVLWDLAPHDLSILLYLTGKMPCFVNAVGVSHTGNGIENIAYLTMRYEDGMIAHVGASWVSPMKVRQILIAGDKKMIAYDDTHSSEKVKIYDAGYTVRSDEEKRHLYMDYRSGDVHVPKVSGTEALEGVINDFIGAISKGSMPLSDGEFGLSVVRILDAADRSLRSGGAQANV